jgi:hypothetical protein
MIPVHSGTVPNVGDRVGRAERPGMFEVVEINLPTQTANLKAMDQQGYVTRYVPWTSLKFQGAAPR